MNESENKIVTQTLDTGIAKPIPVSENDAINVAREQNENQKKADIELENKTNEESVTTVTTTKKVVVTNTNNNTNKENIDISKEKLNEINDLVKIKTVKKENPKIVLALIIILAIIIIGFCVIELPMIIDMLKQG